MSDGNSKTLTMLSVYVFNANNSAIRDMNVILIAPMYPNQHNRTLLVRTNTSINAPPHRNVRTSCYCAKQNIYYTKQIPNIFTHHLHMYTNDDTNTITNVWQSNKRIRDALELFLLLSEYAIGLLLPEQRTNEREKNDRNETGSRQRILL